MNLINNQMLSNELRENTDLNNEVEKTLKTDSSNTLIPGLIVLIITLGILLF